MSMNGEKQSQELANKLWDIANDLRGQMDASKFKNYILGVIFYRYLSEHTEDYMNELLKNDGLSYEAGLANPDLHDTVVEWSLEHLGYFMKPEYMWKNLIAKIDKNEFSIQDFETAINDTMGSSIGNKGEAAFDKLFDDMNLQDKDLGKEVSDRTNLIKKVMLKINDISYDLKNAELDILGTAYMILIGLFASDAGKKGGEFFTPTSAAVLLSRLATVGLTECSSVADCCAGSGSLLLEVQKFLPKRVGHFYAQELNGSTYNLLRMNLIMHGLSPEDFTTYNADTLTKDNFDHKKFMVQVNNPPYSLKWDAPPSLLEDERYSSVGSLAPKQYADLAFVEHMIYHMDDTDGRVAVLLPHGVLFRGGAEAKIRTYLVKELNRLDAVIGLPPNLFHGTPIPVAILIFKAKRNGNSGNIYFIDASKEHKKAKNKNILESHHIDKIVDAYTMRKNIDKFARKVEMSEIIQNDYNLNIPRYVDTSEEVPEIDLNNVLSNIQKTQQEETDIMNKLQASFDQLGIKLPWQEV